MQGKQRVDALHSNQIIIKTTMEKLINFFTNHHGYARMRELKSFGFHTRVILRAFSNGVIDKIKPGLYKLVDYPWDEYSSFVDVCTANKAAVICLVSALEYHELTTFNPSELAVAVPHNTDKFVLDYPPIKVFYFSRGIYEPGRKEIRTPNGIFKIYDPEKTICDMFRYRKKLGEDLALEGLKNYLNRKDANLNKLREYAEMLYVKTILTPYLRALVGE